jgi:hypothetical protein
MARGEWSPIWGVCGISGYTCAWWRPHQYVIHACMLLNFYIDMALILTLIYASLCCKGKPASFMQISGKHVFLGSASFSTCFLLLLRRVVNLCMHLYFIVIFQSSYSAD